MATRQVTFSMSSRIRCVDLTERDLLIQRGLATIDEVVTLVVAVTSCFQMCLLMLLSHTRLSALSIAILSMILIFKLARIMLTPRIEVDQDQQKGTVAMCEIVTEEVRQPGASLLAREVARIDDALPAPIGVTPATSLHRRKDDHHRLEALQCLLLILAEISLGALRLYL